MAQKLLFSFLMLCTVVVTCVHCTPTTTTEANFAFKSAYLDKHFQTDPNENKSQLSSLIQSAKSYLKSLHSNFKGYFATSTTKSINTTTDNSANLKPVVTTSTAKSIVISELPKKANELKSTTSGPGPATEKMSDAQEAFFDELESQILTSKPNMTKTYARPGTRRPELSQGCPPGVRCTM